MSYSRWSNSCWYCYCGGPKPDDDKFVLVDHGAWTAAELREKQNEILENIRNERFDRNPTNYKGEGPSPKDRYTEDEILELKSYMDSYLRDDAFANSDEGKRIKEELGGYLPSIG